LHRTRRFLIMAFTMPNPHPPRVLAIGEVLWDMLPGGKQLGGAAANFAYFASAMGARATLISRVGADPLGDETLARLADLKLDISGITRDPSHETGKASVETDSKGIPRFIIHEPSAWDFIPVSEEMLRAAASADVIYFGTLAQRSPVSRDSIRQLVHRAPASAQRVYDINLRKPFYDAQLIGQSLEMASILKITHEELEIVGKMLELPEGEQNRVTALRDRFNLFMVLLTRGADGSMLVQKHRIAEHPAVKPSRIADTIGAGDSFTASAVMSLLRGEDLDVLHDRAAKIASYVCSQPGATPPLPAELLQI
jgi:fructokinase